MRLQVTRRMHAAHGSAEPAAGAALIGPRTAKTKSRRSWKYGLVPASSFIELIIQNKGAAGLAAKSYGKDTA